MSKRRLKQILIIAAGALLLVVIFLPSINSAWCAYVMPVGFSDANMSGTFSSDQSFSVSGRMFLKPAKQNLVEGETCEVDTVVYYNLWSLYRPGKIVRTRVVGTVWDNLIQGSNYGVPVTYKGCEEFVSRKHSQDEPGIQYLAFPGETTIGSYRTSGPDDFGHFQLR
jgi:hypothetical protein